MLVRLTPAFLLQKETQSSFLAIFISSLIISSTEKFGKLSRTTVAVSHFLPGSTEIKKNKINLVDLATKSVYCKYLLIS